MFPRIYENQTPLDGYAGLTFRILANPTGAEKLDWAYGNLGLEGCPACAALDGTPPYCPACTLARDRLGRAAVAIYGESRVAGFDFATPESALATFGQATLPDELLAWLYLAPSAIWQRRMESLKKTLSLSSPTGS